jgi:hypothetical protein
MHVLYIELSMRLLFREVAPARPGMGALQFGIRALQYGRALQYERVLQFGIRELQYERVLQFGIRAKVSTLSLDGPVEWSLDRGFEEKLCLEDQFRTFECS